MRLFEPAVHLLFTNTIFVYIHTYIFAIPSYKHDVLRIRVLSR